MYFGESSTTIDEKGRITVPRRFRETMDVLGHAVWYMTRGFDHALFLFHREEWNKLRAQANRRPLMNAQALDFRRFLFSGVSEVKPDRQGRMSVPAHLREYAGIEKDAVLIGVDDHLELWSKEAWLAFQESNEARYKEMAAEIFAAEDVSAATT